MAIKSADQISIVDLTDGYSVNLTTDSFRFAGDTTKVKSPQSFSTTIYGYCGSSAVTAAVDTTALTLPTGLSVVFVLRTKTPTGKTRGGVCDPHQRFTSRSKGT